MKWKRVQKQSKWIFFFFLFHFITFLQYLNGIRLTISSWLFWLDCIFEIKTHHSPISFVFCASILNRTQIKWFTKRNNISGDMIVVTSTISTNYKLIHHHYVRLFIFLSSFFLLSSLLLRFVSSQFILFCFAWCSRVK